MFSNSKIALKIKLSRSKTTIVHGIAKAFEKELISIANDIMLGFNETLNKISQKN